MWFNEINDTEKNPMLRLYKQFKINFKPESYIKSISNRRLQKCLSRFRLSSHCLRIHKGRQERDKYGRNTPANKRFCLSCKSGQIDDELHFLFNCPTHTNERENMFSKIQQYLDISQIRSIPEIELLNKILNSTDESVLYELSKFLSIAFRTNNISCIHTSNSMSMSWMEHIYIALYFKLYNNTSNKSELWRDPRLNKSEDVSEIINSTIIVEFLTQILD